MKGLLKWPLVVAAVVIVLRVVLERAGSPDSVNNIFSVVVLYVLVFPLYFAFQIANSGAAHPYLELIKATALYAALARAIVIPTYWLAYAYSWPQPRFSVAQGGVVGPDVTPLTAYVVVPLLAAAVWILSSVVVGGGLGSIVIKVKRKPAK